MSDDFFLYDRITYTIMYFTKEISLEFIVTLASKRGENDRLFFHSEYEKISNYRLVDTSRTVRIRPKYFFSISIKDSFDGGFMIRPSDVYILLETIQKKVLPWFFGSTRIFSVIDNQLAITGQYKQYMYPQSEYKYLAILPNIHQFEDGKFKEGIRLFINSPNVYADLTIDDLLGFLHILRTTDMVSLAAILCNYVKTAPYGVNSWNSVQEQGLGASSNRYRSTNYIPEEPSYQMPTDVTSPLQVSKRAANEFLNKTKKKKR